MTLQQIETIVLSLTGYDKYSSLSVDTDSAKIEDFSLIHDCVNLAREEIKINSNMPSLLAVGATITVIANTAGYSLPTDFDIPKTIYYWNWGSTSAKRLKQYTIEDIPDTLPVAIGTATPDTGTPYSYVIMGTSGNLIQIYLYPTPDTAGIILPIYKPVLTTLTTSTDEDVIMRKYPKVVIDFATAYAFQMIKKDQANYDKYYAYGIKKCQAINLREMSCDPNLTIDVESLLTQKRVDRYTI